MTARQALPWGLPAQRRRYREGLGAVEARLRAAADVYPGALGDACRRTLAAGGKRVRPLLTLLSAHRGRPLAPPVVHAAAAVELLHMATLVHDDVLDRAELRRGRATVAHEFGVELALSAGNYLLARAFGELAATGDGSAIDLLSATAVGLSEGELLQRREAFDVALSVAAYERRCRLKTADLFAAAARLGALLSGLPARDQDALAEFGRLIGLAFQVFDDILDLSGDEARTGKKLGTDIRDGTVTLPLIYALQERPHLAARLREGGTLDPAALEQLIGEVRASGALERARGAALAHVDGARRALETCSDDVERELLAQVARSVVDRFS